MDGFLGSQGEIRVSKCRSRRDLLIGGLRLVWEGQEHVFWVGNKFRFQNQNCYF